MRRSRKRRYGEPHVPLDVEAVLRGWARVETGPGGTGWMVRPVRGGAKTYRCPGCNQRIAPGTAHLVVWPEEHLLGTEAAVEDRRHWHTPCWRRGPGGPRS